MASTMMMMFARAEVGRPRSFVLFEQHIHKQSINTQSPACPTFDYAGTHFPFPTLFPLPQRHRQNTSMAPKSSSSIEDGAPGFLDALPSSVRVFVMGAVALHVFAFAVWGVLFIKEQRQGKVKSKEF